MKPTLAIFRAPSDHPDDPAVLLVAIDIDESGVLADIGDYFTVVSGDSYESTDFNHIILAQRHEVGSINSIRYEVGMEDSVITRICDLNGSEIRDLVRHLSETYEAAYEANRQTYPAPERDLRFFGPSGDTIQ